MQKNKSTLILAASAVILFIGLVSLTYAVNVGNDFDFQSAYRILNASTSSVLGGLSVGTSTAQTPGALYVTGNITSGGSFSGSLSAANVSSGVLGSVAGKGNYTFQAAADSDPVLFVDATNKRIGIGTSTPSAKLSVNGAVNLSGGDVNFYSSNQSPTGTGRIMWESTANGGSGVFSITNSNTGFMGYQFMAHSASDGLIMKARGGNFDITNDGGTRLRLDTSGNVGIGTTAPGAKLDVYASTAGAQTNTIISRANTNGTVGEGSSIQFQNVAGNGLSIIKSIFDGTDNTMQLGTYEVNPTVTLKNGNVGIGTTTPATTLVINGTTTIAQGSLVFPDGSKQTGAVPSGTVIFYDGTSCPTGWSEFISARGRVIVGLPSGGTLGGTVGTALTDLGVPTHTHDLPLGFDSSNWWITANPNFGSGTAGPGGSTAQNVGQLTRLRSYGNNETPVPYLQLLICKKD